MHRKRVVLCCLIDLRPCLEVITFDESRSSFFCGASRVAAHVEALQRSSFPPSIWELQCPAMTESQVSFKAALGLRTQVIKACQSSVHRQLAERRFGVGKCCGAIHFTSGHTCPICIS